LAAQLETGVDHAVDGGVDRGPLHFHEVGEGVVEIENDGSDHRGRLLKPHGTCLFLRLTYHLAQADLAVVDANVESTRRIRADPGFEGDRGAIPAVVRERDQDS